MQKRILFITGSLNQTSQMHQIARELPEYDCCFSQIFADSPFINAVIRHTSLLDTTILAGRFRENSERYLAEHRLVTDYRALQLRYDLVVYCSDLIIPDRMLRTKTIWVQEGMIDPYSWKSKWVKKIGLPPYFSGDTSLNGSSNRCDWYCAASEGYKQYIAEKGTDASKIVVTGMVNYDNLQQFTQNDFPHRDYVMVATSDVRETYRPDNRVRFIQRCVAVANGRQLLFKLHPNEQFERAEAEIKANAPADTLIFRTGNTNEMIANCSELITQYSTVVYVGIALGKKVHSYFDLDELHRLAPLQNGGASAKNIAGLCRQFVEFQGDKQHFTPIAQPQHAALSYA
jgi:hypothetical protein